MNRKLEQVIRAYASRGRVKAGEVLLSRPMVLSFIDDLERLGVEIHGVDFWRVHGEDVVEIPWGDDIHEEGAAESAALARRTVVELWPSGADYASLVFSGYAYSGP